ncbi:hypothetical protein BRADI_1g52520v3 [Brachypodium distachyon]|uniref:Uncharacterized protein n=1 Tax=Brachypodium distachyon TaxID=15368 RepID=I1H258_BRADI|nr:hypothetical protein BRADI_1g52520v3 [Brachypodium distachyon]
MTSKKSNRSTVTSCTALHMEWDRISCPVCMEQPHNAVLLICSSYKNGCRCYICNTSHRHSNCLDRFREMNGDSKVRDSHSTSSVLSNSNNRTAQPRAHYSMISRHLMSPSLRRHIDNANNQESAHSTLSVGEGSIILEECHDAMQISADLKCPLCRGSVSGWIPAGEVRKYLDEKLRTCSHDPCKFVGTYEQLREHARTAHLLAKPAHVDISRKRSWDRLEREQEFGDVISAIRSQNPGAIIVGDYVIETREDMSPDEDSGEESGDEWWSPVRDPMESPDNMDGSPRPWPNRRLGSTSIWGDEQHVFHRFLPQPRLPLSDRRTSRTVWQGIRRSSTQSLMRRGFSNQHYRRSSSYHGYRRTILPRPYADDHRAGINRRQDVPAFGLRRRQRLRYTQGRHDTS